MKRRRPIAAVIVVGWSVFGAAPAAAQFCPSYTASSPNNNRNCAQEAVPGTNPTTAEWNEIFDIVARGPSSWGDRGPSVNDIKSGCGGFDARVEARFPCELLKAIMRHESFWQQFCVPTGPSDQRGGPSRTIIAFDCGYGIAQVTSGMRDFETPDYDRFRVAAEPMYNLATGMRILAQKWNGADCVGARDPETIEHWYIATWGYNGYAFKNNPNYPDYDSDRGIYNPVNGGSYPYQEKVFGRAENTDGRWEPTALAYPNPGEAGGSGRPPALGEPTCATPTNCADTRPVHLTSCREGAEPGGGDEPTGAGGEPAEGESSPDAEAFGGGSPFPDGRSREGDLSAAGRVEASCAAHRPHRGAASAPWWAVLAAMGAAMRRRSIRRLTPQG
ncbi:MAG: hypothetical protein AAGA56_10470 [Myxococcota bacterium]